MGLQCSPTLKAFPSRLTFSKNSPQTDLEVHLWADSPPPAPFGLCHPFPLLARPQSIPKTLPLDPGGGGGGGEGCRRLSLTPCALPSTASTSHMFSEEFSETENLPFLTHTQRTSLQHFCFQHQLFSTLTFSQSVTHRKVWLAWGCTGCGLSPVVHGGCFQRSTDYEALIKITCPHPLVWLMGKWRGDCLSSQKPQVILLMETNQPTAFKEPWHLILY